MTLAELSESRRETKMQTPSLKRTVVAGVAALTMVGLALGAVAAQQTPTASPTPTVPATGGSSTQRSPALAPSPGTRAPSGQRTSGQDRHAQFHDALAAKLGVSPDRLRQAMMETRQELGLPDHGPKAGGGHRGGFGVGLSAAATALNISVEQLQQELPGKTLTAVAQGHNVNPATVASALKTAANSRIDAAAGAGRIPADQVAQAKQRASDRVDQLMMQQAPAAGQRGSGAPTGGSGR
jgi:hypothetical protein